jgi:hypothetical protein
LKIYHLATLRTTNSAEAGLGRRTGLPDFNTKTGRNVQNKHKMYQMAIKYIKWPQTTPNGHKIYQQFPFKDLTKYTQIGTFGLKVNHLETLETQGCHIFLGT